MENSILFMILLQLVLIALNAVFACAEIAVISFNDSKLEKMAESGNKKAIKLRKLTQQPAKFLATIQVAITLSGFLGSAFAAENFSDVLVDLILKTGINVPAKTLDTAAVVIITIILSYITLIFGELVPKRVAMRKAEQLALGMASLISVIAKLFAPIVWMLTASTNGVLRLIGIDPNQQDEEVGEEDIKMMVDVGSEKGTINNEEKEFIQNVFEFDDMSAGEIITHRTDVIFLDMEDGEETWKEIINNSRYSLYPICNGSVDKIIGILNAKSYLRLEDKSRENVMKNAVTQPYFVPATIKADILFRNMKKERDKMAVVLDEYGGMMGIITINGLVSQLVGEIFDNDHKNQELIQEIKENVWKIHGAAYLEDVSKVTGVNLECEGYDTFNGLIFDAVSGVPEDGSCIELDIKNLHIKITEIRNHQIETAIVRLNEQKTA